MTYDELVKDLRYCSSGDEPCESCKRIDTIACEPILMSEAADAIEELQQQIVEFQLALDGAEVNDLPKWISVKERLPEDGVFVLTRYKNNDMVVACVFEHDECLDFWRAMTDEGWCADCDAEPTHWMQLPEPPKEETE